MLIQRYQSLLKSMISLTAIFLLTSPTRGDEPTPPEIKPVEPPPTATPTVNSPNKAIKRPRAVYSPQPGDSMPFNGWQPGETRNVQVQLGLPVNPQPTMPRPPQATYSESPPPQNEITRLRKQLEQAQIQLHIAQQRLQENANKNLPQLENGTLNAYRLKHVSPELLAETLETFLGLNQLRLVPDQENKILLAYSTREVAEQISKLVDVIDTSPERSEHSHRATEAQSAMIRIFWLAEGDPTKESSDPEKYLPEAVIKAVEKLGLQSQKLVAQSATSIAIGPVGDVSDSFQFQFPATIYEEIFSLQGRGIIALENQPQLDLQISIDTPTSPIELSGIITAPRDHFMVLGTANYAGQIDRTTRFAFVVQVTDTQSFAPEE